MQRLRAAVGLIGERTSEMPSAGRREQRRVKHAEHASSWQPAKRPRGPTERPRGPTGRAGSRPIEARAMAAAHQYVQQSKYAARSSHERDEAMKRFGPLTT